MALTKATQAPQASASNAAGATATGAALDTNYGVSGVAKVTNGGTGPTVGCDFVIEVSDGGGSWEEWSRQTADAGNGAVSLFAFALAIGGGADFAKYRTKFTGNTGQAVTVQADAQTTVTL